MHETKKELIRKRRAKRFTDNVFDASRAVLLCKSGDEYLRREIKGQLKNIQTSVVRVLHAQRL